MNLAFKLYRLQVIDSQLDKARGRLGKIETILADDTEIILANQSVEAAETELTSAKLDLKKAETETSGQRDKIKSSEGQLYGGMVTNPKELQDLQREVEALKRHLSVIEDRQLEAMIHHDGAQDTLTSAQKNRTDVEARSVERNSTLLGEKRALEADVVRLEEERMAAKSSLTPSDIDRYERLRKKKNGVAVAGVSDKTCAACGSTLSAALLQENRNPQQRRLSVVLVGAYFMGGNP